MTRFYWSFSAAFIAANLAVGFTFSTLARSQMQAMQMSMFFFLPSMLLSGFMFPFRGMPQWAQALGELLPLTHFLRIHTAVPHLSLEPRALVVAVVNHQPRYFE